MSRRRRISDGRTLVYPETVSDQSRPPLSRLVALAAVTLAVLAVGVAGYVALSGGEESGPPVAPGATGGAFHPIAGNFVPDDTRLEECGDALVPAAGIREHRLPAGREAGARPVRGGDPRDECVRKDCHRIAHTIGSAVFARNDRDVAKTFAVGSATCASGYYHGILERAFVGVNTKAELETSRAGSAPPRASGGRASSTTSAGTGSGTG